MWRDPRHNRWQQRANRQAKRAEDRDAYLTRLARGNQPHWSIADLLPASRYRDKRFIGTSFRCACCGSGWPCCADIEATAGQRYRHDEVCRGWETDSYLLCAACEIELAVGGYQ